MALEFAAAPVRDDIAIEVQDFNRTRLMLPRVWIDWFTALTLRVDANPTTFSPAQLVNQGAAIGTTPIPVDNLSQGLYRITYSARITTAATVSSSLTITLGWTDGGVSCTLAGAALTGNTVSSVQGGTIMVANDQAAPLTYAVAYASVGATSMVYALSIFVEQIS